jgi:hypothetical protein
MNSEIGSALDHTPQNCDKIKGKKKGIWEDPGVLLKDDHIMGIIAQDPFLLKTCWLLWCLLVLNNSITITTMPHNHNTITLHHHHSHSLLL